MQELRFILSLRPLASWFEVEKLRLEQSGDTKSLSARVDAFVQLALQKRLLAQLGRSSVTVYLYELRRSGAVIRARFKLDNPDLKKDVFRVGVISHPVRIDRPSTP